MEMDSNWEFGINCHDAEEKNTPESSTRNWVMTTRTNATRDTWWNVIQSPDSCPVVSYHLCAVTDWSRETMGTTGRSVFSFPIFPRAHLLRASIANILTHFLLEILPKNRLFKVSRAFFWSLSGQKEPKLPETLFYKSSTSLPKFDPDAKYPLPNFVLVQRVKFESFPPLSLSLPRFLNMFFFCWAFIRHYFGGKSFQENF